MSTHNNTNNYSKRGHEFLKRAVRRGVKEGWGGGREEKRKKCVIIIISKGIFFNVEFSQTIHSCIPIFLGQFCNRPMGLFILLKLPKSWLQIIPFVGVQNENNLCIFSLSLTEKQPYQKAIDWNELLQILTRNMFYFNP